MKGLIKENYASLRLSIMLCILCIICLFTGKVSAQYCNIRVASEPMVQSVTLTPGVVTQSKENNFNQWSSFSSIANAKWDVKSNLSKPGFTTSLQFSDFKFNLPLGAIVTGIRVKTIGRSEGAGALIEEKIQLISDDVTALNRSGQGYNSKNVFIKSNSAKTWYYGTNIDTWGRSWTAAQINSASFGINIQLASLSNQLITAVIENLSIEVSYTMAPTFCTTDCFPIYTKLDNPNVFFYKWRLPAGFELISRSENHYIIDLKPLKAVNGLHTISVDAVDAQGRVLQTCNRTLRIRNCTPSTLGNRVWNDINFNGLQDLNEPGIANVRVALHDVATNKEVASTTTNASGMYLFTNLQEATYKVKVTIPQEYTITKSASIDSLNSDFVVNSDGSKNIFLEFNTNLTNVDFGLIKKLTVGDFVWEDLNGNGMQDPNEPGIKDIKVRLLDTVNMVVDTAITDAAGKYSLKGIAVKYKVQFVAGVDLIPVVSPTANPATNSDIDDKNTTAIINFSDKNSDNTIDAGYLRYGSIGDNIWIDQDQDLVFDANEKGVANLKVDLYNDSNVLVKSTTTNAMGGYIFTNVIPAIYKVQVALPDRAILTGSEANRQFRSVGSNNFSTELFTIKSGENKLNLDLGYINPQSKISGKIWNDADASGSFELGEELVSDIMVTLLKEGVVVKSTATSLKGEYTFDDLVGGTYVVKFDIENDLQITDKDKGSDNNDSDVAAKDGRIEAGPFTIGNLDTLRNIDAGVLRKSVIGDFIWEDKNNNGSQDDTDVGLKNIKVLLRNSSGLNIDSMLTDDDGAYMFQNVAAGNYEIIVALPTGFAFIDKGIGSKDLDSDVDQSGSTGKFILPLGKDNLDLDAGLVRLISIGDFVWLDGNADGVQQDNEVGLDSVNMTLLDKDRKLVSATSSDRNGKYNFTNVRPGKYTIKMDVPVGSTLSPINKDTEDKDNDFNADGSTDLTDYLVSTDQQDAGLFETSCIKGFTWVDRDENGLYDASIDTFIGQVLVQLIMADGNVMSSISSPIDGSYSFCNLLPGNYALRFSTDKGYRPTIKGADSPINFISDELFVSDTIKTISGSNIVVNAGFIFTPILDICGLAWQDDNADGIRQESELLLSDITIALINERDTIVDFENSSPLGFYCFKDLPKGKYKLQFIIPPTLQATLTDIGLDEFDSDVIDINDTLTTQFLTLDKTSIKNIDIGLTNRTILGDAVWFDDNGNGINDANEQGAPGYIVRLYNELGAEVELTATSVNGAYLFFNIKSGKYRISFDKESTDKYSPKDVDEVAGSDPDTLGFTELFEVMPNTDYYNFDAGIVKQKLSISGKILFDDNKNKLLDDSDKNIFARVLLFNENSEKKGETTSNDDGGYLFENLLPGRYYLQFDTLPFLDLYKENETNVATLVTNAAGFGTTSVFDLTIGNPVVTNAFYFDSRSKIQGKLYYNGDGSSLYDSLTSAPVADTKVFLRDENKFIIDSTFSDAKGRYFFGKLDVGKYFVDWTTASDDILLVNNNMSDTIVVPYCAVVSDIDAAYTGRGDISGLAFVDIDEDGLDNQAAKLDGIVFTLVNLQGQIIAKDTSKSRNNEFGVYKFSNIKAGKYRLQVSKPLLYIFSAPNVNNNANDQDDSDFSPLGTLLAQSDILMLISDSTMANVDAGFIPRSPNNSSISGTAWTEKLVNGIREGNESFRADVPVSLFNAQGVEISKTITNSTGRYTFPNLPEGFYYLKTDLPIDETVTFIRQGQDSTLDSDFKSLLIKNATPIFYLGISESKTSIDIGIAAMGNVGDFVWEDTNLDGIQDVGEKGIAGVNVYALLAKGDTVNVAISDENGKYRIENIPIGDYVIYFQSPLGYSPTLQAKGSPTTDSDINQNGRTSEINIGTGINIAIDGGFIRNGGVGDRIWVDYNGNGLQEANEPGIDGVKVSLYLANNTFVRSTFTRSRPIDGAGFYTFDDVVPGDYYVQVDLPRGYKSTIANRNNNNERDSDIDVLGKTQIFKILSGIKMDTIDGGMFLPGCIGDRVWLDANKNGIQDINEGGLSGIVIRLLDSGGTLKETLTTDAKGEYLFNTLAQGVYQIEVQVPTIYALSTDKLGDDGAKDSDFSTVSNRTPIISLAHAAKIYDIDAGLSLRNPIVEEREDNAITLYNPKPIPNPALNAMHFDIPFENCELSIYASTGNIVMRLVGYQKYQNIDISGLKAGIYHAIAQSGGIRVSSRFIKVD